MHKITRILTVAFCTVFFLLPASNVFIRNGAEGHSGEEKPLREQLSLTDILCSGGGENDEVNIAGGSPGGPLPIVTRDLPGEVPMPDGERTRYARDIWLKSVTVTERPYEHYGTGVVGETTKFEAVFQNNGSAGDVEIRMKITHERISDDFPLHWQSPVEHKEYKTIASPGGGAEETVTFEWTPSASCWYVVNFTAFEVGDPDQSNNRLYYRWVTVGLYADECNDTGVAFRNPSTNFRIDNIFNDPSPGGHSTPNAWSHCDNSHNCLAGNNTLDLPKLDQNDFWREYAIYALFWFTGELPAGDTHKVYQRGDGGEWRTRASITAEDAADGGVADGWFRWASTDRPAMLLNSLHSDEIELRITVGEGGGGEKGFYFDDLFIWGFQNYTDVRDFKPTARTNVSLKVDTDETADVNENGYEERTGEPGGEIEFTLTLDNLGTAIITNAALEVTEKPEGWEVELDPSAITSEMDRYETREITATVTIADGARASDDFGDDLEFNPYFIEVVATARGRPPNADHRPDPVPEEFTDDASFEVLVTLEPEIALSAAEDNKTGPAGNTLQYAVSVENTGNCNLTGDLDTEVEITVKERPKGAWTVTLSDKKVDVEHGESEDVVVNAKSSLVSNAGYFEIVIEFAIEDHEYTREFTLIAGVDQVFGLEMELKREVDSAMEMNPAVEKERHREVVFELTNAGNGKDHVEIEVTPDNTDDTDWFTPLKDAISLDPAGGTEDEVEFTVIFDVPEDAKVGEHKFTVVGVSGLDPDEETDETELVITVKRPDLQPSTSIVLAPEKPVLGKENSIKLSVYNNGTAPSGPFSVYVYVTPDSGDEMLVYYTPVVGVPADTSANLPAMSHVFEEYTGYTLRMVVDPAKAGEAGNVTETDESNNEAEFTIVVVAPDLAFDDTSLEVQKGIEELVPDLDTDIIGITAGLTHSITVSVENTGDHDAEDVTVDLKVIHTTEEEGDVTEYTKEFTIDSIEAGDEEIATFSWLPALDDVEYRLLFTLDSEGSIPESDEDNNELEPDAILFSPKDDGPKDNIGSVVITSVVVIVIIAIAVAAVFVLMKKKKKEDDEEN